MPLLKRRCGIQDLVSWYVVLPAAVGSSYPRQLLGGSGATQGDFKIPKDVLHWPMSWCEDSFTCCLDSSRINGVYVVSQCFPEKKYLINLLCDLMAPTKIVLRREAQREDFD